MRLIKGEKLTISAKDVISNESITIEGKTEADLTELLLKAKLENMTEQEYLDRRYIWDIAINYDSKNYIAISITINGWVFWLHNTEL